MKFITKNSEETTMLGYKLANILKDSPAVILLNGDLAAGKTTFTKGIGLALNISRIINSPTFTIMKKYESEEYTLYHLDLYRLNDDYNDMDLYDYINSDKFVVIEWPYKAKYLLPNKYFKVSINKEDEETRTIEITGVGIDDSILKPLEKEGATVWIR